MGPRESPPRPAPKGRVEALASENLERRIEATDLKTDETLAPMADQTAGTNTGLFTGEFQYQQQGGALQENPNEGADLGHEEAAVVDCVESNRANQAGHDVAVPAAATNGSASADWDVPTSAFSAIRGIGEGERPEGMGASEQERLHYQWQGGEESHVSTAYLVSHPEHSEPAQHQPGLQQAGFGGGEVEDMPQGPFGGHVRL